MPLGTRKRPPTFDPSLYPITMTIQGENKTVAEWSRDERCQVTYTTLMLRVRAGFPHNPEILLRKESSSPFLVRFVAYSESGRRLGTFVDIPSAERSILESSGKGKIVDRTSRRLIPIPRTAYSANPSRQERLVSAWGETKNLYAWSRDHRCAVCLETLYARFRTKKSQWTPESAISTPSKACFVGDIRRGSARLFSGFGEEKDLYKWARDPRCEISRHALKERLLAGMPVEEALRRGGMKPRVEPTKVSGVRYTAFNETKPFSEWLRDPRCQVSAGTLREHLHKGLPMAVALIKMKSGPAKDPDKSKRPPPLKRTKQGVMLTLFGETKSAVAWSKDSRAQIGYKMIVDRIRAGFDGTDPRILLPSPRFSVFRRRFQALDADGNDLGLYATIESAAEAVLRHTETGVVRDVTSKRERPVPLREKPPKPRKGSSAPEEGAGEEPSESVPLPRPGVALGYERSAKGSN